MPIQRIRRRAREHLGEFLLEKARDRLRRDARLVEQSVSLAERYVPYAEGGEGEPVVLLHGFTGERLNWYRFARELTGRHRVVIPDLPPFGEASATAPATVEAQCELVREMFDALGIERAHVVGNSMGGHVATLFALRYPERAKTLALLCPAGIAMPEPSAASRLIAEGTNSFVVRELADLDRFIDFLFAKRPLGLALVAHAIVRRERSRAEQVEAWLAEYLSTWVDLEPHFPNVSTPTLVLWGDRDGILDKSCLPIFERIPGATGILMKDCGHLPMMERPRETASHYISFVERVARSPSRIA